ncbi:hypothetical protein CDAR_112431 [Caerostris darwini]|uniref:Uncharacterized protein n=1 Tax=Caerostris darwini TaxID=1538125 RepID=A0AAV4PXV7_9ARAC|nr:hypothetical protein CDAR_112431 [Caerostris darwini]
MSPVSSQFENRKSESLTPNKTPFPKSENPSGPANKKGSAKNIGGNRLLPSKTAYQVPYASCSNATCQTQALLQLVELQALAQFVKTER